MDKEKVKLIIRNMELLLDSLRAEVLSDGQPNSYKYDNIHPMHPHHLPQIDYDEIFGD
jgi:hypothetical protein